MKLKHLSLLIFTVICFNNEIFAQIYSTGGFFGAGGNRISNGNLGGGGGGSRGSVLSIGGSYSSIGEIDLDSYVNFDGNGAYIKWRTGMWGAKAEYLMLINDLGAFGEQVFLQLRYSAFVHYDIPNTPVYGELGFGMISYIQESTSTFPTTPTFPPGTTPVFGNYEGVRNFIPITAGVSLPLGSSMSFDLETGMNYLLPEKIDGGGETESVFAFSGIRGGFSFYF